MKNNPQILGLALGGGAFRGTAHLGVLKALEEEGLRPGFLCGTSAGAMAAAFYAFGMPPEENPQHCTEFALVEGNKFYLLQTWLALK